ncbi:2TM domain-containing protein [Mangrovimonas aestuarii]|uniref:2TM domain-containing protein n=1 Tax=Mangrovimonas aestuarii TaxID=3018443 RepID=UPI002378DDC1|nr:2TM domain-containing protein [Mangrovimonas aestuarii]
MKKIIKQIILLLFIGTLIFFVGIAFTGTTHIKSVNGWILHFLFYQLYTFVLGFSNLAFFRKMDQLQWKGKEPNRTIRRVLIGIIGSVVITLTGLFVLRLLTDVFVNGNTLGEFLSEEKLKNYVFGLWITLTVVIAFHVVYFYNKYQQQKLKQSQFVAKTETAKFDALKNQLDPHFLFNSLNVLTSLIDENPKSAQEFTTGLSKVYRYVLEQKDKELVTVDEELDFARTYMSLLKMRFEDSLMFTIPERSQNPESKVVPLSLQLLLENAVKHNVVTSSKPLHITIYEEANNLIVENNLQPKQTLKKSSGVGLSNIVQRYALLTSREININQNQSRFSVAIPMLTKQVSIMKPLEESRIDNNYLYARKRVESIKEFYTGLIAYCLVNPFLIFINFKTYWGFQWFWFPLLGWGIGLAIHAYMVFVNDGFFGRSWEKRKIEQFMKEEEQGNNRWS